MNLLEREEDLDKWREQMRQLIDEGTSLSQIFSPVTAPYALTMLEFSCGYMSVSDFSRTLAKQWVREEREILKTLPDRLTVYRGVRSLKASAATGLSWTLDLSVAEWFAVRFGEQGVVYTAQVQKEDVLAYFEREDEIILSPKPLTDIEKIEIGNRNGE